MIMYNTTELLNNLYNQVEKVLDLAVREWQNLPPSVPNESGCRTSIFLQKNSEKAWSAAQCLEHLNIYGRHYLPEIEKGILTFLQKNEGITAQKQFKSGWLGGYFHRMMLPKNDGQLASKMNAPKNAIPPSDLDVPAVIAEFIDQQERTLKLIDQARQVNLGKIRVPISLSKWIKLKLGDTFLFLLAHQYRHILQINKALGKPVEMNWTI
jgi:hypothetical protein